MKTYSQGLAVFLWCFERSASFHLYFLPIAVTYTMSTMYKCHVLQPAGTLNFHRTLESLRLPPIHLPPPQPAVRHVLV